MSLETTTNRSEYAGNGVTTVFSFPYYFIANADLVVILRNNTTGAGVVQTITTHYTLSGAGEEAGGSVTMLTAPPTGYTLIVYRSPAIKQEKDFRENDSMPAEQIEEAYDLLTMLIQRVSEQVSRALRAAEATVLGSFSMFLPVDVNLAASAGKTIIVKADLTGFEMGPTADDIENAQQYAADAADSAADAAAQVALAAIQVGLAEDQVDLAADEVALAAAQVALAAAQVALATAQANAAAVSAAAAAASASAAAISAAASQWSDVRYLTFADSPFTVTDAMAGSLLEVDASGGAVAITLPAIAGLTLAGPWSIGIKKTDSSSNAVTATRGSTDTIDGSTTKATARQYGGFVLVPDTDASPDRWAALSFGEVPIVGAIVGTTDAQALTNKTFSDAQTLADIATPSNPASGFKKLYAKTLGLFFLNSAGTESRVQTTTLPTIQKFTSGSGTYTTPSNVKYIQVELIGAGGGGGATGAGAGDGGTGGNTTFGSTVVVGNGGTGGGSESVVNAGSGGTTSLSGASGVNIDGAYGMAGNTAITSFSVIGGGGGNSALGGAGGSNVSSGGGQDARANSGSGGGGAISRSGNNAGGGGGSGGYCKALIFSPSATYAYAIGAGGAAGAAGAGGYAGGVGGSGLIVVTEYYF